MPCEFATITETNDAAFCQSRGEMLNIVRCPNGSILIKNDAELGAPFIAESAHRDSVQRNVAEPAAEQGQLE